MQQTSFIAMTEQMTDTFGNSQGKYSRLSAEPILWSMPVTFAIVSRSAEVILL